VIYFISLLVEIVLLFFLSGSVSKTLSKFLSINSLSIIFLPGVIIHELSHLLIATILFVPVGDMEFTPRKDGDGLKLGSVKIAQTDPLRRSLIGFAPIFMGLMIVVGLVYFFGLNISFLQKNIYIFVASITISTYLLFAISNTMFSSKADMKGTIEIVLTLLIIFAGLYVLGLRFQLAYLDKILTKELIGVIQKSILFLLAPIAIDVVLLGIIKALTGRQRS
jgi:hypothetical protein